MQKPITALNLTLLISTLKMIEYRLNVNIKNKNKPKLLTDSSKNWLFSISTDFNEAITPSKVIQFKVLQFK